MRKWVIIVWALTGLVFTVLLVSTALTAPARVPTHRTVSGAADAWGAPMPHFWFVATIGLVMWFGLPLGTIIASKVDFTFLNLMSKERQRYWKAPENLGTYRTILLTSMVNMASLMTFYITGLVAVERWVLKYQDKPAHWPALYAVMVPLEIWAIVLVVLLVRRTRVPPSAGA